MKNCPLFEGLTEREYSELYARLGAKTVQYNENEKIYSYNEDSLTIGVICSGTAKIVKNNADGNEILLENLKSGGIFGNAISFAERKNDDITITSITKCEVVKIPFRNILLPCDGACKERHSFILNLFRTISAKSNALSERIEIISNRTIRDKLLCYFRNQSVKFGSSTFRMEMTLSALSEFLCADRSAMMRELKKLKTEGILSIVNKKVTLIK